MPFIQDHKKLLNSFLEWLLLLLPAIILFAFLGDFIYEKGSLYSDLSISHYPNAIYLRDAILRLFQGGGLTFWSSTILSGYPFAADPLSGIWYVPDWLALLFPLPLGINLVVLLHLIAGGIGLFLFLQSLQLNRSAALFSAVLFEASPILFLHFTAGHITLVYAFCWTPWLLYGCGLSCKSKSWSISMILPGIILGMMALADIRWAALGSLLLIGFWIFPDGITFPVIELKAEGERLLRLFLWTKRFLQKIQLGRLFIQGVVAILVAAPLLIPLIQYTSYSTRAFLSLGDNLTYSLPPAKLLGILFPDLGGFAEWIDYLGGFICILGLLVWFSKKLRRQCSLWMIVSILSLIFALGAYTPFYALIVSLPGFNLLRVPARSLLIFGLSADVLAAYALDTLLSKKDDYQPFLHIKPEWVLTFVALFVIVLSMGVILIAHTFSIEFIWGALAIAFAGLWTGLRLKHKIGGKAYLVVALAFSLVDLWGVNLLSIQARTKQSVLSEGEQAASYLSTMPGLFRVYSPSYSISQQTAIQYGLQLADGIDPLQLGNYVNFMKQATGVTSSGYSVTLPAFSSGDPAIDNQGATPDSKLLGLLNVKYVVSSYNLSADGLQLIKQFGDTRIYQNQDWQPRAWWSGTDGGIDGSRAVQIEYWSSDKITLKANGSGTVVLSEIVYPGWQVWVDGKQAQIITVDGILRAVQVSSGQHIITFIFRPLTVYIGMGVAILFWIGLIVFCYIAHSLHCKQSLFQ